ncbi:hypothetical protein ACIKTA_18930 [Hansschlegelia beijingensis]
MSVAFTKEQDFESVAANLPDRPISSHRNLVTPEGLSGSAPTTSTCPR